MGKGLMYNNMYTKYTCTVHMTYTYTCTCTCTVYSVTFNVLSLEADSR